jgi:hypothetical protein
MNHGPTSAHTINPIAGSKSVSNNSTTNSLERSTNGLRQRNRVLAASLNDTRQQNAALCQRLNELNGENLDLRGQVAEIKMEKQVAMAKAASSDGDLQRRLKVSKKPK